MTISDPYVIIIVRNAYNITRRGHYGLWISGSPQRDSAIKRVDRPLLLTLAVNREVYFLLINETINTSNAIKKVPNPNSTMKLSYILISMTPSHKGISLLGATVKLERGNPERDKNGHTLGYIWMKNGPEYVNFNKLLVQRGFAKVANLSEPNTKYLDEFIEAENEAKQEQLKIWSIEGYVTDDGFDMSVYGR